jgi:hypothetical protein
MFASDCGAVGVTAVPDGSADSAPAAVRLTNIVRRMQPKTLMERKTRRALFPAAPNPGRARLLMRIIIFPVRAPRVCGGRVPRENTTAVQ